MHRSTKPVCRTTGTTPKKTPNRLQTPKNVTDENERPSTARRKPAAVSCNILKRQNREETSSSSENVGPGGTPKTPLMTSNIRTKTPTAAKRTPCVLGTKSPSTSKPLVNGTPKRTARQPECTKTTPTKRERSTNRSVLFEFSDDILLTPGRRLLTEQGTPASLSVKTSSTISIINPSMPQTCSSQHSSFNRSHSASSLSHSKSSDAGNGLLRSQSEVKLSSVASSCSSSHGGSGESSRVTVGVRVRPLHYRESGNTVFIAGNEIRVASDLGSVHSFAYDYCFPSTGVETSTQEGIYDALVKPLVDTAFQGYNACLFAYGQTGSGKTYSMMGPMHEHNGLSSDAGIIPRFCQEVLSRASVLDETTSNGIDVHLSSITTSVEISYLEVYNEKIHDLLAPGTEQLKVREHPVYGPYVVDLSKHITSTYSELQHWINIGNQKRATAATEMNDKSSRSHSLFTVILTQTFAQVGTDGVWSHDQTRRSQINLVDLAGSERIAHSSVSTDRLREGVSINKSLLTLGKVMTALIEKRSYVPYRDSVLTWLLKESLGGNSRTTMLATVSPSSAHIEETLSTLRYASQARSIINTVRVNEAPQDKLIRELRAEIEKLKNLESEHESVPRPLATPLADPEEIKSLQCQVKRLEDDLEAKTADAIQLKDKISILTAEKQDVDAKLSEYIENNRQLASKIASEKFVKQNLLTSREGETKALVDELVNLREQHKSLKQHYLNSQDELEFERGAKHQIMSEKEKDAGEIAALKAEVARLYSDLLSEKNEVALRDCELKKLKSDISEMQLAQDNLTTTFLLKEEFCDAQAIAEIEKIEIVAEKDKEIDNLKSQLKNITESLQRVATEIPDAPTPDSELGEKIESIARYLKTMQNEINSIRTSNAELVQRLDIANSKVGELHLAEESLQKEKEENDSQRIKLEKLQLKYEVLVEEIESWKNKNAVLASSYSKAERDMQRAVEEAKSSSGRYDELKQNSAREIQKLREEIQEKKGKIEALDHNFKATQRALDRNLVEKESLILHNDDLKMEMDRSASAKVSHSAKLTTELESAQRSIENLEASKGHLEKELDSLKQEKANFKEKEDNLIAQLDILKIKNANYKVVESSFKAEVESLKTENEKLKRKENYLKTQLDSLKMENNDLKQKEDVKSKLDSLKIQFGALKEKENNLKIQSESLKIENLNLKETERQLKTQLESLKAENSELKEKMDKLVVQLESANLKDGNSLKTQLETNDQSLQEKGEVQTQEHTKATIHRLESEIRALQERNKYLRKKASKSKKFSSVEDAKDLKTEISRLKKVNMNVVGELEKVRELQKLVSSGRASMNLKDEMNYLRAELSKSEKLKSTVDGLLQAAKQEMETALAEMKVLRSENATLEKRASKTAFENENLREQLVKMDKERGEMSDKLNRMSGEKSVTDYKLRMSLVNTKSIEDKEEELKQLYDKQVELKDELSTLKSRLADSEHQLSLIKLNEDTMKSEVLSKCEQIEALQKEITAAQQMQRQLMEEKLALVKVMEKHFNDHPPEDHQAVVAENSSLKKEVRMYQQRLDNKCEKVVTLDTRVCNLEGLLIKVIDDKIRSQLELEDLRSALINKDYNAYDIIMGAYLPHHLEYLVRKARVLVENYTIPYDIDLKSEENKIIFQHLVLKAVAVVNRTLLNKWINKIESQKQWSKEDEQDLPWKVDFDSLKSCNVIKSSGNECTFDPELYSAHELGVKKTADGTFDPIEWRRTLIARHVRGMRDDYRVLIKYFGTNSAVYAILERIRAAVDRLEQVTTTALDN